MANYAISAGTATVRATLSDQIKLQFVKTRRFLLWAVLATSLVIGAVVFLHLKSHVPFKLLTRDIFAITGAPVYFGILSNLGIIGWAGATTAWTLTTWMRRQLVPNNKLFLLALASGGFSLLLMVDDALMLHEDLLPRLLGIPEELLLIGYGLLALLYLVTSLRAVWHTPYLPWLLSGALLGGSISIDFLMATSELEYLLEDGLKFAGIIFWLTYAVLTCLQTLEEVRDNQVKPIEQPVELLSREVGA